MISFFLILLLSNMNGLPCFLADSVVKMYDIFQLMEGSHEPDVIFIVSLYEASFNDDLIAVLQNERATLNFKIISKEALKTCIDVENAIAIRLPMIDENTTEDVRINISSTEIEGFAGLYTGIINEGGMIKPDFKFYSSMTFNSR